jgi:GNAT superfamily N-acetyltransferase
VPDNISGTAYFVYMQIRKIERGDLAEVIRLMRDFAEFEKLLDGFETTEDRMNAAMFGTDAFVHGLVAEDGDKIVAYALFYPNYLSFRGQRGFWLEDLYVSSDHRRSGLGEKMLKEIAKAAASRGFERIDFVVLDWNSNAIGFYTKLGAVRDPSESHFKFTDNAFLDLAG